MMLVKSFLASTFFPALKSAIALRILMAIFSSRTPLVASRAAGGGAGCGTGGGIQGCQGGGAGGGIGITGINVGVDLGADC